MHISQRLYSCWKHHWNMLAVRYRTASLVAVMTSLTERNLRTRRSAFLQGNRQKSHGARSGEYGGCGSMVTCCLASFSWTRTERCSGALSCSNSQFNPFQSSGCGLSLQLQIIQETPCFVSSYDPVEKRWIIVSTTGTDQVTQIIMQSSRWSWIRTHGTLCWVTHDTFRSLDSSSRFGFYYALSISSH